MLRVYLSLTSTTRPATDLGYLLHKHPDRAQRVRGLGRAGARVLPRGERRPVHGRRCCSRSTRSRWSRGRGMAPAGRLRSGPVRQRPPVRRLVDARGRPRQGVPDRDGRPLRRAAGAGRRSAPPRDPRARAALPRRSRRCVRALFEPLGWTVGATPVALDETVPGWGDSRYVDLRLTGPIRLADALTHLYVLLPVLDDAKHYWVSPTTRSTSWSAPGGGWLAAHPERQTLSLQPRTSPTSAGWSTAPSPGWTSSTTGRLRRTTPRVIAEPARPCRWPTLRREAVSSCRHAHPAPVRSCDFGCGEGALVASLLARPAVHRGRCGGRCVRALAGDCRAAAPPATG